MSSELHTEQAPFAYEGLDRAIHERARLGLITSLLTHPKGLAFNDLKQLCALTDGNLSRHLRVLEEEGIVNICKRADPKRTVTVCRLTADGRTRYIQYLNALEQVLRDAATLTGRQPSPAITSGRTPSRA